MGAPTMNAESAPRGAGLQFVRVGRAAQREAPQFCAECTESCAPGRSCLRVAGCAVRSGARCHPGLEVGRPLHFSKALARASSCSSGHSGSEGAGRSKLRTRAKSNQSPHCFSQPGVSKPRHFKAHAQSRSSHHGIGGCEHRDAGLGCHREMKRVQAAQPMLGVTRDQIRRL
jgi:hypothetical protein